MYNVTGTLLALVHVCEVVLSVCFTDCLGYVCEVFLTCLTACLGCVCEVVFLTCLTACLGMFVRLCFQRV